MHELSVFETHLQALEDVYNYEDMMTSQELALWAFKQIDTPQEDVDKYIKAWNKRFNQVKHNRRK